MMEIFHWEQFDRTSQDGCLFLDENDVCFYYMKKPTGLPSDSKAGQLIFNIKINPYKMSEKQRVAGYKEKAIKNCAEDMSIFLGNNMHVCPVNRTLLVPIPPSTPKNHVEYDDRMAQVCKLISKKLGYRFADCLESANYLGSLHKGDIPRDIDLIINNTIFHSEMITPDIRYVFLVDDQLTKGTHFKAMKRLITGKCNVQVFGLFWAKQDSDYLYRAVPF